MEVSVSAKVNDLRALQRMLDGQASRARLLRAASGEAKRLVQMGFATESDPNGNPWLPLKYRKGKILRDTARMANSFTTNPIEDGFTVGSNVSYVGYHQDGTRGVQKAYTHNMVRAYTGDSITAYKLNTKRGRFLARKQVAKLAKQNVIQVKIMAARHAVGSGKIPARNMVPPNGVLTEKWRTAIDTACNSTMATMAKEAGAK